MFYASIQKLTDRSQILKAKIAKTKQEITDIELANLKSEEDIDTMLDQQIITKIDTQQAKQQAQQVLHSTETFLRDAEKILREKLNDTAELQDALASVK